MTGIAEVLAGERSWWVEQADCLAALRSMPDASVAACVTDPPGGIGFMGKAWDTFGRSNPNAEHDHGSVFGSGTGLDRKTVGQVVGYADADGLETIEDWRCAKACPIAELDRQSGNLTSGSRAAGVRLGLGYHGATGDGGPAINGSTGTASRFFPNFHYEPKASATERSAGLENLPLHSPGEMTGGRAEGSAGLQSPRAGAGRTSGSRNHHPTVKPVGLMLWLVTLVTPPGGTVLDPFCGSGTTGIAALRLGHRFIGIDQDVGYVDLARRRIAEDAPMFNRQAGAST